MGAACWLLLLLSGATLSTADVVPVAATVTTLDPVADLAVNVEAVTDGNDCDHHSPWCSHVELASGSDNSHDVVLDVGYVHGVPQRVDADTYVHVTQLPYGGVFLEPLSLDTGSFRLNISLTGIYARSPLELYVRTEAVMEGCQFEVAPDGEVVETMVAMAPLFRTSTYTGVAQFVVVRVICQRQGFAEIWWQPLNAGILDLDSVSPVTHIAAVLPESSHAARTVRVTGSDARFCAQLPVFPWLSPDLVAFGVAPCDTVPMERDMTLHVLGHDWQLQNGTDEQRLSVYSPTTHGLFLRFWRVELLDNQDGGRDAMSLSALRLFWDTEVSPPSRECLLRSMPHAHPAMFDSCGDLTVGESCSVLCGEGYTPTVTQITCSAAGVLTPFSCIAEKHLFYYNHPDNNILVHPGATLQPTVHPTLGAQLTFAHDPTTFPATTAMDSVTGVVTGVTEDLHAQVSVSGHSTTLRVAPQPDHTSLVQRYVYQPDDDQPWVVNLRTCSMLGVPSKQYKDSRRITTSTSDYKFYSSDPVFATSDTHQAPIRLYSSGLVCGPAMLPPDEDLPRTFEVDMEVSLRHSERPPEKITRTVVVAPQITGFYFKVPSPLVIQVGEPFFFPGSYTLHNATIFGWDNDLGVVVDNNGTVHGTGLKRGGKRIVLSVSAADVIQVFLFDVFVNQLSPDDFYLGDYVSTREDPFLISATGPQVEFALHKSQRAQDYITQALPLNTEVLFELPLGFIGVEYLSVEADRVLLNPDRVPTGVDVLAIAVGALPFYYHSASAYQKMEASAAVTALYIRVTPTLELSFARAHYSAEDAASIRFAPSGEIYLTEGTRLQALKPAYVKGVIRGMRIRSADFVNGDGDSVAFAPHDFFSVDINATVSGTAPVIDDLFGASVPAGSVGNALISLLLEGVDKATNLVHTWTVELVLVSEMSDPVFRSSTYFFTHSTAALAITPVLPTGVAATWSAPGLAMALPGLDMAEDSGVISGTPNLSLAGTSAVVQYAACDAGSDTCRWNEVDIRILPPLTTPAYLPEWSISQGVPTQSLVPAIAQGQASDFVVDPAFSLPGGMALSFSTGAISGTPTERGTFTVRVLCHDLGAPLHRHNSTLVIHVLQPLGNMLFYAIDPDAAVSTGPLNCSDALLASTQGNMCEARADFVLGRSMRVDVSPGFGSVSSFSLAGTLPGNVTFDFNEGLLHGLPDTHNPVVSVLEVQAQDRHSLLSQGLRVSYRVVWSCAAAPTDDDCHDLNRRPCSQTDVTPLQQLNDACGACVANFHAEQWVEAGVVEVPNSKCLPDEDPLVMSILMGCAVVVVVVSLVLLNKRFPLATNAVLMKVLITVFDFSTDIIFILYLAQRRETFRREMWISVLSVAISVAVNFTIGVLILLKQMKESDFRQWFSGHPMSCAAVLAVSSMNVGLLELLESKLFYLNTFEAPLSQATQHALRVYSSATVILEDLPQLCLQMVVILRLLDDNNPIGVVVMASMVLSSLSFMLSVSYRILWCIFQIRENTHPAKLPSPSADNTTSNTDKHAITNANKPTLAPVQFQYNCMQTLQLEEITPDSPSAQQQRTHCQSDDPDPDRHSTSGRAGADDDDDDDDDDEVEISMSESMSSSSPEPSLSQS